MASRLREFDLIVEELGVQREELRLMSERAAASHERARRLADELRSAAESGEWAAPHDELTSSVGAG